MTANQNTPAPPPPRRRVDLRRLPYGLGYVIAALVALLVILAAHHASLDRETPHWWNDYALPILYWSSPLLVGVAVALRYRAWRRRRDSPPAP